MNSSRFEEEEDGLSPEDLSNLIDAQGIENELQNIESDGGMNDRSFKILSERDMISSSMLVNADVQENSVFNTILNSNGLKEEGLVEDNYINKDISNQNTKNRELILLRMIVYYI